MARTAKSDDRFSRVLLRVGSVVQEKIYYPWCLSTYSALLFLEDYLSTTPSEKTCSDKSRSTQNGFGLSIVSVLITKTGFMNDISCALAGDWLNSPRIRQDYRGIVRRLRHPVIGSGPRFQESFTAKKFPPNYSYL